MGEISTNAFALVKRIPRRPGGARMFIAKRDMLMHKIAHSLDAPPTERRIAKKRPGLVHELVRVTVATAEQKHESIFRQILYRMLTRFRVDEVVRAGIAPGGVGPNPRFASRRDNAAAPVAKAIAIGLDGNGRIDHQIIGIQQVSNASVVNVQ